MELLFSDLERFTWNFWKLEINFAASQTDALCLRKRDIRGIRGKMFKQNAHLKCYGSILTNEKLIW